MTLKEAQNTVDKWITTTGVRYFSELTNMAILTEEVGEVARIIARRYGEQSFKKSDEEVDLADEFVKLITTQRAFQANSKVITTSDEVLSDLINIKR